MAPSLSDASARILCREADAAAKRLCRRLGLAGDHIQDIAQDLLVDLLVRLSKYRSDRGSLGAFANIVFRNRASRLSAAIRRERAMFALKLSIEESFTPSGLTLGDLLSEACGYGAMLGQRTDDAAQTELRLSVQAGLRHLPPEHRRLCAALSESTIEVVARSSAGARSTLYRQLERIRLDLAAAGVGPM